MFYCTVNLPTTCHRLLGVEIFLPCRELIVKQVCQIWRRHYLLNCWGMLTAPSPRLVWGYQDYWNMAFGMDSDACWINSPACCPHTNRIRSAHAAFGGLSDELWCSFLGR